MTRFAVNSKYRGRLMVMWCYTRITIHIVRFFSIQKKGEVLVVEPPSQFFTLVYRLTRSLSKANNATEIFWLATIAHLMIHHEREIARARIQFK